MRPDALPCNFSAAESLVIRNLPCTILTIAGVVGSALLYGWAYPPHPHPWLSWFALALLFVLLRHGSTARRMGLAWLWTVAMAYTVNDWFPRAVSGYFGQPAIVGFGLFLGVSTFTAGVQYMGFAALLPRLAILPAPVVPLAVAAGWVTADVARLWLFGGDPWALLGYAQVDVPRLVQIADLTGVHGITFVCVTVNTALAELWIALSTRRPARGLAGAATASALLIACLAYGTFRLHTPLVPAGDAVPVGIVQVNLPLGSQWHRELYGRNLDAYLSATLDVLRRDAPPLVVWPENAMTFFVTDEPTFRSAIHQALAPFPTELIAGGPWTDDSDPPRYYNSAFRITAAGEVRERYDKAILLPFAEYFPLHGIDLLRRRFERVREFAPGGAPLLLPTAAGPAGVVICNEGFFAEPARTRTDLGARLLVNLANDSWLGDPKYSEVAFDMVRLRAVEQRRWIVRASTSGPSALIDPYGRVQARTALFANTTLTGTVTPYAMRTPYARIGDVFAWCCAVLVAVACLRPTVKDRGRRGAVG